MNYRKIYNQLISKRLEIPANLEFQYTQKHHIIPRSIEPQKKDDKTNLVILSAREHFIAHALLVKIAEQENNKNLYYKMLCAFTIMKTHNKDCTNNCNSKLFQKWRIQKNKFIIQSGMKRGLNSYSYNKILIHNIKTEQHIWINKNQIIPKGWKRGKSEKKKGNRKSATRGTKWIFNPITLQQKLIKKEEQLPQGWQYGMSPISKAKTIIHPNPTKGKIWITNSIQNKLWNKNQQIPKDWIKGRKIKK